MITPSSAIAHFAKSAPPYGLSGDALRQWEHARERNLATAFRLCEEESARRAVESFRKPGVYSRLNAFAGRVPLWVWFGLGVATSQILKAVF